MKQKWLLTGTALMLAAALAGCGNTPAADQTAKISMEQAQTAALDAANIEAADADISSATLSEVAGITCYKVEFTSAITPMRIPSTPRAARCWRRVTGIRMPRPQTALRRIPLHPA